MKKIISAITIIIITISISTSFVSALKSGVTTIQFYNEGKEFSTDYEIIEGRTLIPLRMLEKEFNMKIQWDGLNKIITISKYNMYVQFQLNNKCVFINGNENGYTMDIPPMIIDNRSYVPLRVVSEIFGKEINYLNKNGKKKIEIFTRGY